MKVFICIKGVSLSGDETGVFYFTECGMRTSKWKMVYYKDNVMPFYTGPKPYYYCFIDGS